MNMVSGPLVAVVALWNQIQGLLLRFSSIFIASATLEYELGPFVMSYLWKHYKRSSVGMKSYVAFETFVKPMDAYECVASEQSGDQLVFYKGLKVLFVGKSNKGGNSGGQLLRVSCLRGTVNLEKLIIDAVDNANSRKKLANGSGRFRVRKIFGHSGTYRNDSSSHSNEPLDVRQGSSPPGDDQNGLRPLKYTLSDLGYQSSTEPFANLRYSGDVTDMVSFLKKWKESKAWYREKGLEWRFGFCAYGPPGTGKTSFVRAVAQLLDLPVFIFDLNTMSNKDLSTSWRDALNHSPCVVLFEDLDRMFDNNKTLVSEDNKLTLDCLLNCISGVEPSNGILTAITANDPNKFDSALGIVEDGKISSRPGRLDKVIYFGNLADDDKLQLAEHLLSDFSEEEVRSIALQGGNETGAQFKRRCEMLAIERYWRSL